jgi:hypothetical protein
MVSSPPADLLSRLTQSTASKHSHTALTSAPMTRERGAALARAKAARAARDKADKAREQCERRQAQLWLAVETHAAEKLQAVWRGKLGRALAAEQDKARPGVRKAVRLVERLRVRAEKTRKDAEAEREAAERERLLQEAAARRQAWQEAMVKVKDKLKEEKMRQAKELRERAKRTKEIARREESTRRAAEAARLRGESDTADDLRERADRASWERRELQRQLELGGSFNYGALDGSFKHWDDHEASAEPLHCYSLSAGLSLIQEGYAKSYYVRLTLQVQVCAAQLTTTVQPGGYVTCAVRPNRLNVGPRIHTDDEAAMASGSFVRQPAVPAAESWGKIRGWHGRRRLNSIVGKMLEPSPTNAAASPPNPSGGDGDEGSSDQTATPQLTPKTKAKAKAGAKAGGTSKRSAIKGSSTTSSPQKLSTSTATSPQKLSTPRRKQRGA